MTNIQPTIIETFVGAGGAHLGFKKAGFKSLLVNDIDNDTIQTLLINKVINKNQVLLCPIEDITEEILKEKLGDLKTDILFGGIVCKGFSLAGVRNPFDNRNYLYKEQLRLVKLLKPKNLNLMIQQVSFQIILIILLIVCRKNQNR